MHLTVKLTEEFRSVVLIYLSSSLLCPYPISSYVNASRSSPHPSGLDPSVSSFFHAIPLLILPFHSPPCFHSLLPSLSSRTLPCFHSLLPSLSSFHSLLLFTPLLPSLSSFHSSPSFHSPPLFTLLPSLSSFHYLLPSLSSFHSLLLSTLLLPSLSSFHSSPPFTLLLSTPSFLSLPLTLPHICALAIRLVKSE